MSRQTFAHARGKAGPAAFLICMICAGLVLLRAVPPFAGFDEAYHWYRALQISEGGWFAPQLGPNDWGGAIDLPGIKFAYWFAAKIAKGEPIDRADAQAYAAVLAGEAPGTYAIGFPSSAAFAPTAYVPTALAVYLARDLGAGPLGQNAAGRLAQLLVYAALVWATVRLLPRGRLVVLAILTMPTCLHLATSFSADPVNLALPALFVAYCLAIRADPARTVCPGRAAALIGLAVLLGTLKLTYCPAVLFLILIPRARFRRGAARWPVVGLAAGACIVTALAWTAWYTFIPGPYWHAGGDPQAALSYIEAHPLATVSGLFFTIYDHLGALWQDASVRFGGHPAPYHFWAPAPFGWCELAALAALAVCSGDAGRDRAVAGFAGLVAALIVGLILVSFRLAYGAPDVSSVTGIQGRYFIPAVLLAALALCHASRLAMPRVRSLLAGLLVCNHLAVCAIAAERYATLWR
jgi:uncharacterized membrane protein